MSGEKYLDMWKVEEVLKELPPQEHKEFLTFVVKKLKKFKLDNEAKLAIEKHGWKVCGAGFMMSLITTCMAGALSRETGDPLSIISAVGLGTTVASFIGFNAADKHSDEETIKRREELSEDAKVQIKYLQAKIRRIESKNSK